MKKEKENLFEEIMSETLFNLMKETFIQVQKTQRVPGRINPWRNTLKHIVIKLTKIKDKDNILKATREKQQIT